MVHATAPTHPGARALLGAVCAPSPRAEPTPPVAIVCAHPDDEIVGAGGRLPHLHDVRVVHVTDGAPRDGLDAAALGFATRTAYAQARATERARALALAGVRPAQLHDVGLCDQEASHTLFELALYLTELFELLRPRLVLTHAYEGGHPDHDATALAVHAATTRIRERGGAAPAVAEMTAYHARGAEMVTGEFLPVADCEPRTVTLREEERALKQAMLACHATQQRVLAAFPTDTERFRVAPAYDFTAPPHDGPLFYERFDWGVTGAQWRALAQEALGLLGHAPAPA